MGSSSTTTGGSLSTLLQNSGSDEDLLDQKKRKRMISNRESARRSRMRKQKHVENLMEQVTQLRKENQHVITSISVTTQHYLKVESENSVLRAQMDEIGHRLESLNEITSFLNLNNGAAITGDVYNYDNNHFVNSSFLMNNSLNLVQQPIIMASEDIFQY
jgi:hypothetical protein